jgi:hypothetical protein
MPLTRQHELRCDAYAPKIFAGGAVIADRVGSRDRRPDRPMRVARAGADNVVSYGLARLEQVIVDELPSLTVSLMSILKKSDVKAEVSNFRN